MKNRKSLTLKELTIDYIISATIWYIVMHFILILILPKFILAITSKLIQLGMISDSGKFGIALIIIMILPMVFEIFINSFINLLAVNITLNNSESIDEAKATKFIDYVSLYWVIMSIILKKFYIFCLQHYMSFSSWLIITLITVFIIRKSIKKKINKLIIKINN